MKIYCEIPTDLDTEMPYRYLVCWKAKNRSILAGVATSLATNKRGAYGGMTPGPSFS